MSGLLRKSLIVNGKRVVTGLTKHLRRIGNGGINVLAGE